MKMYFEMELMNHEDPWDYLLWSQKYLEDHVTLLLVHVTIKWKTKWHKSKHKEDLCTTKILKSKG